MGAGTSGGEDLDYSYPAVFYRDDSRMPVVGNVNEFDQRVDQAFKFIKEKASEGAAKVRNLFRRKEG